MIDTQYTPTHEKLWHREFWMLTFANLFLSMSVCMLIPILPKYLMEVEDLSSWQVGIVMGVYSLGLFVFGPLCNWLIQRYRRNSVCLWAVLLMVASLALFTHGHQWLGEVSHDMIIYTFYRFVLGAFFGLSQMVLCSTLIIDISESFKRTEANLTVAWFSRMGLPLGALLAIALDFYLPGGDYMAFDVSAILSVVAFILIMSVKFPFKVPDENVSHFSLDRFFLSSAWLPFLNLILITTAAGILLTMKASLLFYGMLLLGLTLALLSEKHIEKLLDPKVETMTGLAFMALASLISMTMQEISIYITPILIGYGLGLVGTRFLLYFIQLSLHCQRGTSQSSFFLAWECGIGLGLFVGYSLLSEYEEKSKFMLALLVAAWIIYKYGTYTWCVKHKNR